MVAKEALARIKINTFLKEAGWRLLDDETGPANVVVEINVKLSSQELAELGDNLAAASGSVHRQTAALIRIAAIGSTDLFFVPRILRSRVRFF